MEWKCSGFFHRFPQHDCNINAMLTTNENGDMIQEIMPLGSASFWPPGEHCFSLSVQLIPLSFISPPPAEPDLHELF